MISDQKFIKINHEGDVLDSNLELMTDSRQVKNILNSIKLSEKFVYTTKFDQIVEVFDFPYLIQSIELKPGKESEGVLQGLAQYGISLQLNLNEVYLDYKDRFIIYSESGIPCVLTSEAQNQLFDMCDEFSDDEITLGGKKYPTSLWLNEDSKISNSKFWSERYVEQRTEWDLNAPSPCLVWALQKFKLPKMRVAVLGCGKGHDAAHIARLGHKTTGFDFSSEAIQAAKNEYSGIPAVDSNIEWICEDVFNLNERYLGQFDLVLDHTMYCAIDPLRRDQLVNLWSKLLAPQGQILGIFFIMPRPQGPPYGSTEEEIQTRIRKKFRKDFWERSRVSEPKRLGKELIVLATKNDF